jgi:hypothetical protein
MAQGLDERHWKAMDWKTESESSILCCGYPLKRYANYLNHQLASVRTNLLSARIYTQINQTLATAVHMAAPSHSNSHKADLPTLAETSGQRRPLLHNCIYTAASSTSSHLIAQANLRTSSASLLAELKANTPNMKSNITRHPLGDRGPSIRAFTSV